MPNDTQLVELVGLAETMVAAASQYDAMTVIASEERQRVSRALDVLEERRQTLERLATACREVARMAQRLVSQETSEAPDVGF